MNKATLASSILIILVVFCGFVFFIKQREPKLLLENGSVKEEQPSPNNVKKKIAEPLVEMSLVEEKKYQEKGVVYFDISYPHFKNVSTEFNKEIEDVAISSSGIEGIKKEVVAAALSEDGVVLPANYDSKGSYYQDISWKPVQINNDYISILIKGNFYLGGDSDIEQSTFNYDVKSKREIRFINQLFSSDEDYLKWVSQLSREEIGKQLFKQKQAVNITEDGTNKYTSSEIDQGYPRSTESAVDNFLKGLRDELTYLKSEVEYPNYISHFTFTPETITYYGVLDYREGGFSVELPR